MTRHLRKAAVFAGSAILLCITAGVCSHLGSNRATAAMLLLLEILAIATLGDWILALLASTLASLAFSFYFVDDVGSFRLTTIEGMVTFMAMVLTAFTGSRLSIRAQRRAAEAERRRSEMERLNQFGRVLLSADRLRDAADEAVRKVVELFDLDGAVLRVAGAPHASQWGEISSAGSAGGGVSIIALDSDYGGDVLELHGRQPSEEVGKALASMMRLALGRARSAEERHRVESVRRGEELHTTVLNALAHNFKTPLTSIKAAASMLRLSGRMASAHERELVVVIDEEADRLEQLIRESLDLAKLESRRQNPKTEECRMAQIVERVVSRISRYLGRREFIIDMPEDLPAITGDSFLFEQMLVQVVDNAWKYSRPGAPIRISGTATGGHMSLTVWNGGSEIPEDERDRIFDRFYRGTKDRHRIEGTGLGLAIARAIAEACDGKIWLDVEPQGPAFHFQLPLRSGPELQSESGNEQPRESGSEPPAGAMEETGKSNDRKQHYLTH
ncbi:MAG TPA: ATP-binding protein [Bryobacteraceae bacterium]|nr:ATP-binding protein [Bryobacteraceae bacterium]